MSISYWRKVAGPIIARVLRETKGEDESVIKRALCDAYPFGPRKMWPYHVWLDEIKFQRHFPRTQQQRRKLKRKVAEQEELPDDRPIYIQKRLL